MKPAYWCGWGCFRLLGAAYFRWRVCNAELVPPHGPVILAANHASYVDPLLIGAALPREIHYLARESLFAHPLLGRLLRAWNCVPVDRAGGGAAGLKAILERLLGGAGIILFPEGTRTTDGRLQPARAGIGLAVLKSTCPVVPTRIFGTWAAYGRHLRLPRPRRVVVKFGPVLDFQAARAEARTCAKPRLKALYQEVANDLMGVIAKLDPSTDVDVFPHRN